MTQTQELSRVSRIEERINKDAAGSIEVTAAGGGMQFKSMVEVMEFAKLMAVSDVAIPKHLRGNVGACLAVCIQAVEWRMSPYAVANKSYVVADRVSYESQLIHAVVEQRAPIISRLRNRFEGEGNKRRCIVWATAKGQTEPMEYRSPETGEISPKNSPLWKTKPDLQLFYNASRDWARMYFPDVILGVYAEDELEPIDNSNGIARQAVAMPRAIGESAPGVEDRQTFVEPAPEGVNTDTGEVTAAAESDAQPEAPADESQVAPASDDPITFNEDGIAAWLLAFKPENMQEPMAKKLIKGYLKTGLSRDWSKLKAADRTLYVEAWKKGAGPFAE